MFEIVVTPSKINESQELEDDETIREAHTHCLDVEFCVFLIKMSHFGRRLNWFQLFLVLLREFYSFSRLVVMMSSCCD